MADSLRVLLAVANEAEAADVEAVLRARWPGLVLQNLTDPTQLHQALRRERWDLLVVGMEAPSLVLETVREIGWNRLLIAISGAPETQQAADLLQSGIRAVVHRSGMAEIVPIVAREIGTQRDQRLRRQADKALARSEARYRRLFEASQDGIVVVDAATGAVSEVNPFLLNYLGHPAQAILGKVLGRDSILAPLVECEGGLDAVRAGGGMRRDGVKLRTADGRTVWADVIATCHDIDGDSIIQFNLRDVTEWKRSEEGLSRANRALRTLSRANESLIHASSESDLVEDACRIIVKVGEFLLAWVAYPEEGGANGYRVVARHGRGRAGLSAKGALWPLDRAALDLAVTSGPQVVPLPGGGGGRSALVLPLHNAGQNLGVVTIVADEVGAFDSRTREVLGELAGDLAFGIRAQRDRALYQTTEAALRDSELRFRTMAESASDALIVMDADGCVAYWNKAAERIFGYSAAEALGRHLHSLVASEQDLQAHRAAMEQFSASGAGPVLGRTIELVAYRKDGTPFPVELTVSGTRVNGRWQALGIVRDVSERKLIEEQLHQADKMDALGNMAGGIAHDLKNMLFPVLSLIGLTLKELPEGSRQRARLEKVLQATERARALVERIHAFSHREAISRAEVEVSQALTEALGLIRPMLPTTIRLNRYWTFRPGTRILVDLSQFDAILMNFASNAADAMEGHPGTLTISGAELTVGPGDLATIPVPRAGAYVWIAVSDTGSGMSEEICAKVFEPWFSTKGKGKGTGLGLAMVRKIIIEHGGAVTVTSHPGQGATFTIYLPQIVKSEGMAAGTTSA